MTEEVWAAQTRAEQIPSWGSVHNGQESRLGRPVQCA